ncbi:MAG: putative DNA-binding domain-containing protein [Betaproteobacteria bacterium]|nr:putative DNA-binding domain-containing protein [Betaproteobacteria bacterium]
MSATSTLQQQFQDFILAHTPGIEGSIRSGPRVDAAARLAIYANAYCSRLTEVLDADYPALRALAGDALFQTIALAYIAAHPSDSPNARWFGRHLPAFLIEDARFAENPVLAEMAAFEWAMSLAYDAADAPVVEIAALAAVSDEDWPEMVVDFQPSLQVLNLRANVAAFWQADHAKAELPQPLRGEKAATWIVWRRELVTYFRSLEADEAWALQSASAGNTFAGLCEGLLRWHAEQDVPMRAIGLLKRWIGEGLASGLRTVQ